MRFLEEVEPDGGKAERSQTTGHLVVTLPRMKDIIMARCTKTKKASSSILSSVDSEEKTVKNNKKEKESWLEITPNDTDFTRIVQDGINDMPPLEAI